MITGCFHFQCGRSSTIGSMVMQLTGHGATHSSQPVHSDAMTVCICFAAPAIASTGQAWMHKVQPMHVYSSMKATDLGFGSPTSASSGFASTPSSSASFFTPSSPPGGQRLMSASPLAIASA